MKFKPDVAVLSEGPPAAGRTAVCSDEEAGTSSEAGNSWPISAGPAVRSRIICLTSAKVTPSMTGLDDPERRFSM